VGLGLPALRLSIPGRRGGVARALRRAARRRAAKDHGRECRPLLRLNVTTCGRLQTQTKYPAYPFTYDDAVGRDAWEFSRRLLGADVAINYKAQDFVAETQKFTDGKGVNIIIENVATDNLTKDFAALARDGRIVLIGTGTGKSPDATFCVFGALTKDAIIYGMSLVNAGPATAVFVWARRHTISRS
jgi:Zinc-binding dehydrogenase